MGKEKEITSGQAALDSKTQELADTDEKNAQAKEDLTDTTSTLKADEEFLSMLKEHCANLDAEWAERQKTRQLEMEATSKALALFSKTLGFVQTQSAAKSRRRTEASKVLSAAAKK